MNNTEPVHRYCDCKKDENLSFKKNSVKANQGNGNMSITKVDSFDNCVYCGHITLASTASKVRKNDYLIRRERRMYSDSLVEIPLYIEYQQMYYGESYNETGSIYE